MAARDLTSNAEARAEDAAFRFGPSTTRAEVTREVASLLGDWGSGEPTDAELHRECTSRLAVLRSTWREHPEAFDVASLAALKGIAEALRGASEANVAPSVSLTRPPKRSPPAGAPTPHEVLRSVFGYESFRPGQEEIIRAVLDGRDCIGVMPTGAGKSLTFQIPAEILGGTTLVISPLIALMKDQVDAMREVGIAATFLNSSLDPDERRRRVTDLKAGRYRILYAAPEGIEASVGGALSSIDLRLIAVDEAHCISHWGHDFRPAYRNLAGLKARFGGLPVLALTATATQHVTDDIVTQLAMSRPAQFRGSFYRRNLHLHAYKKGEERGVNLRKDILRFVAARSGQSGIVYCLSRKSVESMAEYLRDNGVRALPYHAGMESEARTKAQDAFRNDDADVIVATVAFGMGIDKSNIRYVVHRDMPRSIEGYYQEIGRAGRDGVESDCLLFYSWADVMSYDRFSDDGDSDVAEQHRLNVREMFRFADKGTGCRHQRLVGFFGESMEPCTTSCDVCARSNVLAEAPAFRRPSRQTEKRASNSNEFEPRGGDYGDGKTGPLFQRLRALRRRIADEKKLAAYIVFSDFTLLEMARLRPRNVAEMAKVSGVGPKKLSEYGELFLAALQDGD